MKQKEDWKGHWVVVHPELTTDPAGMQGKVGRIVSLSEDEAVVEFPGEDFRAAYEPGGLLILQPPELIAQGITSNSNDLQKPDALILENVYQLVIEGRHEEAIEEALKSSDAIFFATTSLSDWLSRDELQEQHQVEAVTETAGDALGGKLKKILERRLSGKEVIISPEIFGDPIGREGYGRIVGIASNAAATVALDDGQQKSYPTEHIFQLISQSKMISHLTSQRGYYLSAAEQQYILSVLQLSMHGKVREALRQTWQIKDNRQYCIETLREWMQRFESRQGKRKGQRF